MAERRAVANGNWSNVATWDGGTTLPQAGDNVRSNNFTVTIDQDVNVALISTAAGGSAVQGGGFQITSLPGGGGRTVTAAIATGGASGCLTVTSAVTSGVLNLNGSLTSGTAGGLFAVTVNGSGCTINHVGNIVVQINGSGTMITVALAGANITWTTTGNITGVGGGSAGGLATGIRCTAANPNVTVVGDLTSHATTGHSQSAAIELFTGVSGTPVVTVTGTITCTISSFEGLIRWAVGSGTLTINGNCSGAAFSVGGGVVTATVNGNVANPSQGSGSTFGSASAGTLTVTGTVSGGSVNYGLGVSGGAHTVTLAGAVTAGSAGPGVLCTSTTAILRMRGPFTWGTNNEAPFVAHRWLVYHGVRTVATAKDDSSFPATGANVTISNTESNGFPAPEDVAAGTVYGEVGDLLGTMIVEADPETFWNVAVADLDTPDSVGARLAAASTTAAVGALIAAALGE